MSSYVGFSILTIWIVSFCILSNISKDPYVFIIGLIFTFPILFLTALLDTKIDSRSKINHGRK